MPCKVNVKFTKDLTEVTVRDFAKSYSGAKPDDNNEPDEKTRKQFDSTNVDKNSVYQFSVDLGSDGQAALFIMGKGEAEETYYIPPEAQPVFYPNLPAASKGDLDDMNARVDALDARLKELG